MFFWLIKFLKKNPTLSLLDEQEEGGCRLPEATTDKGQPAKIPAPRMLWTQQQCLLWDPVLPGHYQRQHKERAQWNQRRPV